MKHRKIPSWNKLIKDLEKASKDPKFVRAVKEFINITSGRRIYKP